MGLPEELVGYIFNLHFSGMGFFSHSASYLPAMKIKSVIKGYFLAKKMIKRLKWLFRLTNFLSSFYLIIRKKSFKYIFIFISLIYLFSLSFFCRYQRGMRGYDPKNRNRQWGLNDLWFIWSYRLRIRSKSNRLKINHLGE